MEDKSCDQSNWFDLFLVIRSITLTRHTTQDHRQKKLTNCNNIGTSTIWNLSNRRMEKKSSRHQPIQQQGNARGKKTTRKEYGRGKKKYHQQKRSCSRARARALVQPLAILHMNFFIFPFCALYAHRFLYVFLALCLRTIFWPMFCISLLPLLFFAAFFCMYTESFSISPLFCPLIRGLFFYHLLVNLIVVVVFLVRFAHPWNNIILYTQPHICEKGLCGVFVCTGCGLKLIWSIQ